MTQYNKDEESKLNILTPKKLRMIANALQKQENLNEGDLDQTALNFNFGFTNSVINKIVGHVDLELTRARNKFHIEGGMNTKELLKR